MNPITKKSIEKFKLHLINNEKTNSTITKYVHDITQLQEYLKSNKLTKAAVLEYKSHLCKTLAPPSVNAAIASLNSFFQFINRHDLRVKALKMQKQIFASTEKELTKAEYHRLLTAAKKQNNERLLLLMQTVCSTGIRVSELQYITVDAVNRRVSEINCKGKRRRVILPKQLCEILKAYIKKQKIKSGTIFRTRSGKPLDRSNIWSEMKKLCKSANVSERKVFPHNLRHLFARTYYSAQKDISRLADILGHSSINTTRIYTMETGTIHQKQIDRLDLLYHPTPQNKTTT